MSRLRNIESRLEDLHQKVDNLGSSPEETWICALLKAVGVSCDEGSISMYADPEYKPEIPLSYEVRSAQVAFAGALRDCFADQIAYDPLGPPGPMQTDLWTPGQQIVREKPDSAHGLNFAVQFDFTGFDPGASKWVYGNPAEENTTLVEHPDATLTWDNEFGASVLHINRKQTVTKHQSTTTETDDIIKIDIGSKIGATIGGKESGGSIEAEITANIGITHGVKDVKSLSTDETVEVGVNTDIPVGDKVRATFSSPRVTTVTPFSIDGFVDSNRITMAWDHGISVGYLGQLMSGPRYFDNGRHNVWFEGYQDLYQALEGTNVNFPGLKGPIFPDCPPKIDNLRKISWKGTLRTVEDQTVYVSFKKVN